MTFVAIETLNTWGAAWAGAMWRSLVEGTALLVVVGLAWLILRRQVSSALWHGLFLLVLIKVALPVALPLTFSVSVPSPPTLKRMVEPIRPKNLLSNARAILKDRLPALPAVKAKPPVAMKPRLSRVAWLMLAWVAVVTTLTARFIGANVRMDRRLRGARPIDSDELPVDPVHLAVLAGLQSPVPIVETNRVVAPAIWGLVQPRLLIPPGLIKSLSVDQLKWALLHELVHVRRGDTWVLLFQRLMQILFFFNPAVWVANRAAGVFREFACDDASLALSGVERHDCGAGFVAIAEWASRAQPRTTPIGLGLFGTNSVILTRLERILDDGRPLTPALSRRAVAILAVASLVLLPVVRAQAPALRPSNTAGQAAPLSTLQSGTTIGGQVKDSAGRPMAGVLVHVISKGDGDGDGDDADTQEHSHKTDAEGRWQCGEVPADLSKTWFRMEQPGTKKTTIDSVQSGAKTLDHKRFQSMIAEMMRTELELIETESHLMVIENENRRQRRSADAEQAALIEAEFKEDPEVVELIGEIKVVHDQLQHIQEITKHTHDPALMAVRKQFTKLMDRYENLWRSKYGEIQARIREESDQMASAIENLRKRIATLRIKKEKLAKNLEQIAAKTKR